MTLFTVHAPRKPDGVAVDPAEFVFVKDGFCWPALLIPPVWLIWRRLWLTLLIWVAAVVVLAILSGLAGSDASTAVMILFAFWFALEANGFRRWTLERRGYVLVGVVEGRTLEESERHFFAEAAHADVPAVAASSAPMPPVPPRLPAVPPRLPAVPPVVPAPSPAVPARVPAPRAEPGIVGLFPTPGHRR